MFVKVNPIYSNFSLIELKNYGNKPTITTFRGLESLSGDSFSRQSHDVDISKIEKLDIKNLRVINSTTVRGECLASKSKVLRELKNFGIETVIDLRGDLKGSEKYANRCRAMGLDYFNIKIKDSVPVFLPRVNIRESIDEFNKFRENYVQQLKKFFNLMDNGKVYLGCLLGLHRSDLAVTTNYLLNPQEPKNVPVLSHMIDSNETNFLKKRIRSVMNLYNNLTPEQRKFLGLPNDYRKILSDRIEKLIIHNTKI